MNPQLIIAAVIAATAFAGGWTIQSWRYGAKENERAKQELANVQQAAAADIRRLDNTIAAQSRATARTVGLRRDRDLARTELDRLRAAATSAVPSTCDASAPGTVPAATGNQLLLECAAEITDLAGKADRHASDVKTLIDAWPK